MSKNTLVVYYSWSNGNTRGIAARVAEVLGADVAEIETSTPYPEDHEATVMQGKREVEAGFTPPIEPLPVDPRDYDRIILGTPTWWYTMAPAMRSFLDEADLSGKEVAAFFTNGGWPGDTAEDLEDLCEGADFGPVLEVRFDAQGGDTQVTPMAQVDEWVAQVAAGRDAHVSAGIAQVDE